MIRTQPYGFMCSKRERGAGGIRSEVVHCQQTDNPKRCRLHDLRHTFATGLAERGVSKATMLALMGHMSRAMLERYSHIRMAAKVEAVAGLTLRPNEQKSEAVPVKVPVSRQTSVIQWLVSYCFCW